MLPVARGVNKYGLYQQRLALAGADKSKIVRAVCRIDFDLCASVADAESVSYALADCSGELFACRALVLVIDLRACAACGVKVDFDCQVIAVLVDMCYALGQIERRVIVNNIGCAGVVFKNLAYVLAYLAPILNS